MLSHIHTHISVVHTIVIKVRNKFSSTGIIKTLAMQRALLIHKKYFNIILPVHRININNNSNKCNILHTHAHTVK